MMNILEAANYPEMSSELRRTIAAYDADPVGYRERYAQVDVSALRQAFMGYVPAGAPILDAGCGTGRDIVAFHDAGYNAVGIDLSEGMLDIAAEACPKAMTVKSDVRWTPFNGHRFFGVWAMASLVHLGHSEVEEALAEFKRVLVAGGWLLVTLKAGGENSCGWEGDRWFSYWAPEQAHAMIERAGFGPSIDLLETEGIPEQGSIGGKWINALVRAL